MHKKNQIKNLFLFGLLIGFSLLFSFCREDKLLSDPDAQLAFSDDTISFDTIFTSVGSTIDHFIIKNENNGAVEIDLIELGGGPDSYFRLNIDGIPTHVNDQPIVLSADDSLYVFVEVTIDPNEAKLPFIVEDSVAIESNGQTEWINLLAYGQNAIFLKNKVLCDEIWTSELPYVLFDTIYVPPNCRLTVEEGARIHAHVGATIFVGGTLEVNGGRDASSMAIFQGDRLERDFQGDKGRYQEKPGQWNGIYFLRGSRSNLIEGAYIKNANFGIRADSLPVDDQPLVRIRNSIIENMGGYGIWGRSSHIVAENCLIFDCGVCNVNLEFGGLYEFSHCTFANFSNRPYFLKKTPIMRAVNYLQMGNVITGVADYIGLDVRNSILLGEEKDGLLLDKIDNATFDYNFSNCIIRTDSFKMGGDQFIDCIFNPSSMDTMFVDYEAGNLRLNTLSPAINAGLDYSSGSLDLEGNTRDAQPDIGCYEFK